MSNASRKTIKCYEEELPLAAGTELGVGELLESHEFTSNDGNYTFTGLKEGTYYNLVIEDSSGEKKLLNKCILTDTVISNDHLIMTKS